VGEGDVVAVIESPELDRQYDAAVADAAFKRSSANRSRSLASPGVVSQREAEQDTSQAEVAEAQLAALKTQKSYETLRAPFAGTVTARFADPGALVQNASSAQTSALPLVTISTVDRLRVYAYLDQHDAADVRAGDPVEIAVPGRGLTVHGSVARVAGELDPKTRTMLVESDVDNRASQIVPGSYVSVSLELSSAPQIELPVEALLTREGKTQVAVVGDGDRVQLVSVTVASDDGTSVRLASGLSGGERVALDLGDRAHEGQKVQPFDPQAPSPRAASR
jgi:RND family efflux transporter MFP subunit